MNKVFFQLFVLLVFVYLVYPASAVNVASCQVLGIQDAVYELTVGVAGPACFNITADNVTLDCNGFAIDATGGYAIVTNRTGTTIRDCVVDNADLAVNCSSAEFMRVDGLNVSSGDMLVVDSCHGSAFTDVRCTGICSDAFDIFDASNVTIVGFIADGGLDTGLYADSVDHMMVSDVFMLDVSDYSISLIDSTYNVFSDILLGQTNEIYNIYLRDASGHNNFTHVDVQNENAVAVYIEDSDFVTFEDVNCTVMASMCVLLENTTGVVLRDVESFGAPDSGIMISDSWGTVVNGGVMYDTGNSGVFVYVSDGVVIDGLVTKDTQGLGGFGLLLVGSHGAIIRDVVSIHDKVGLGLTVSSDDNNLSNVTILCNASSDSGLVLDSVTGNIIESSRVGGCALSSVLLASSTGNLFYNNLFNSTVNVLADAANSWNTTYQEGMRVHGVGLYIGGNFWASPTGDGFSENCTDADFDGICDDVYVIDADNRDWYALSVKAILAWPSDFVRLMGDAGSGLGGFLTAITPSTVSIILGIGTAGALLMLFVGIAYVIRDAAGRASKKFGV